MRWLAAALVFAPIAAADSLPVLSVCKAMAQSGSRVRLAGVAQSIPEGLVVLDRGCTIYKRRKAKVTAMVLVTPAEFQSEEVRTGFNNIPPSPDSPFVKVVVEGPIDCKPDIHFTVTDEGEIDRGSGFGILGLYVCRMPRARLVSLQPAKGRPGV